MVIAIGYTVILIAHKLSDPLSKFFDAAKMLSEAVFLLLYAILVVVDCIEFLRKEHRENEVFSTQG